MRVNVRSLVTALTRRRANVESPIPSSSDVTLRMPNQVRSDHPPKAGKCTSFRYLACHRRSNGSLAAPASAAATASSTSARLRLIAPKPFRAVVRIAVHVSRSPGRHPGESGLGHHEDQPDAERDLQQAADDDRHPEVDVREADRGDDRGQRGDLPELLRAEERRRERVLTDLTREPCLGRAARERVRDAPQDLRGHDRADVRVGAFHDEADAHPDVADDHRQTAAVDVRDDARRDLEDEHRGFHERADEHQLERVQARRLDAVQRRDREDHGRDERAAGRDHQKDEPRPRTDPQPHRPSARQSDNKSRLARKRSGRGQSSSMKMHSPGQSRAACTTARSFARSHERQAAAATRVVADPLPLLHIGDAVFELHEHVGTVVEAQAIARAQVLVDPHPHNRRLSGPIRRPTPPSCRRARHSGRRGRSARRAIPSSTRSRAVDDADAIGRARRSTGDGR